MEYRTLGRSGLKVSALALGTFTFGGRGPFGMLADQQVPEARSLVDLAIEHGVNFVDTANMYSLGLSEEILGEVIEGRREDLVISSKARMPIGPGVNDQGASRLHLLRECERSLKRLRTDRIDIYHLHEWDGTTPVEETCEAMDTLVRHGKIRYWGFSNFCGWQAMKLIHAAEALGTIRPVTQQIHYTLEAREAEYELLPLSVDQGIGVTVWSPLAAGLLTGKHGRDRDPAPGSRQASGWTEPPVRDRERLWRIVDVLAEIAGNLGAPVPQVALAWLLGRPAVASLIVGARTTDQLAETLRAVELTLSEEERERLEEVSRPPLIYPHWHQNQFAKHSFSEADWALHRGQPETPWG
ncbi:MAG: Aldo/keto reductase, SMc04322 family [uncultured Rubellimicrobium sp.]|uniref:Aldo/keto reductase, SMc04322 family n=1 Tax=uncultured Rubellimicrobium sp. TaxID=543078 RepID=A0A6J4PPR3_9RHOB|nr:MAG: Aldo/keto reductase, SMc04322 family [uncultured Rubellimicrobium sp.]